VTFSYPHAHQLVQRNVLIDDRQNACLADFGLSTVVTDETLGFTRTTSTVSGLTTRWASPELLEDDAHHQSCHGDLWAFGCVCYEVCIS
jgi:serine/threonine protein kinase